jgi:hypothetical protein
MSFCVNKPFISEKIFGQSPLRFFAIPQKSLLANSQNIGQSLSTFVFTLMEPLFEQVSHGFEPEFKPDEFKMTPKSAHG